jgi:hypothetical protein
VDGLDGLFFHVWVECFRVLEVSLVRLVISGFVYIFFNLTVEENSEWLATIVPFRHNYFLTGVFEDDNNNILLVLFLRGI